MNYHSPNSKMYALDQSALNKLRTESLSLDSCSPLLSNSSTSLFLRPPVPCFDRVSPFFTLSTRTNSIESTYPPSGRMSRLANRVNTLTILEPCISNSIEEHTSRSFTEQTLTSHSHSFLNSYLDDPSTPWYRFCRPAAPVLDRVSISTDPPHFPQITIETQIDQENINLPSALEHAFPAIQDNLGDEEFHQVLINQALIQSPRQDRTLSGRPLSSILNILQSPVMFGERIPKWSVIHRQSSELIPEAQEFPPIPSSNVLHSPIYDIRVDEIDEDARERTTPTPPVPTFLTSNQSCCFTSQAAPGLTRPTVLKRELLNNSSNLSGLAEEEVFCASSACIPHFPSVKRSVRSRNSGEGIVKKSRFQPLMPSEHSAFLPVRSKRC